MNARTPIACVVRDTEGNWVARIEQHERIPENRCLGSVFKRVVLPVPPTATRSEAENALGNYLRGNGRRCHGC